MDNELVIGDKKQKIVDTFSDMDLVKLFKKIEGLGQNEQKTVKSLIDAYVFRFEMQSRLVS